MKLTILTVGRAVALAGSCPIPVLLRLPRLPDRGLDEWLSPGS